MSRSFHTRFDLAAPNVGALRAKPLIEELPDGMPLGDTAKYRYKAQSKAWHSIRGRLITGTKAAPALGWSPYKRDDVCFSELASGVPDIVEDNAAMRNGRDNETDALLVYSSLETPQGRFADAGARYCPLWCDVGLCISSEYPFLAATPDAIRLDTGGIVEVKVPYDKSIEQCGMNPSYYLQMQMEMLVANATSGTLVIYTNERTRSNGTVRKEGIAVFDVPRLVDFEGAGVPILASFHAHATSADGSVDERYNRHMAECRTQREQVLRQSVSRAVDQRARPL